MSLEEVRAAHPGVPCPDCAEAGRAGVLRVERMPEHWHGGPNKPWVYLCDTRRATGCRGKATANPDGSLYAQPVTQAVRTARIHCHAVFDKKWQSAELCGAYPAEAIADPARVKQIRNAARNRMYAYIAWCMGLPEEKVHVGQMTDLDLMRRWYVIARDLDLNEVRRWAKARKRAEGHDAA